MRALRRLLPLSGDGQGLVLVDHPDVRGLGESPLGGRLGCLDPKRPCPGVAGLVRPPRRRVVPKRPRSGCPSCGWLGGSSSGWGHSPYSSVCVVWRPRWAFLGRIRGFPRRVGCATTPRVRKAVVPARSAAFLSTGAAGRQARRVDRRSGSTDAAGRHSFQQARRVNRRGRSTGAAGATRRVGG